MARAALATQEPEERKGNALVAQTQTHYQNARGFLEDVRAEMRKVVTPSRKEVQSTTTVVLVTVFIFAGYFFVVDYLCSNGVALLMNKLTGAQ